MKLALPLKPFLVLTFVMITLFSRNLHGQVSFPSSCTGAGAYTVNVMAVPVAIQKTNNGGGCNVNVIMAYSVTVNGNIPNGWCGGAPGGSLDNLRVKFQCSGGDFDAGLPRTAASGTVCACNNQGVNSVPACAAMTYTSYCANTNVTVLIGGPGLSSTSGTIYNPLPIELVSFDAQKSSEGVQLKWITATETNNDYFTLEKSNDAFSWVAIGRLDGAGNSQEQRHYAFGDAKPYSGYNYYRLRQTDFNGNSRTSNVIAVDCSSDEKTFISSVFPNPSASNTVNLRILNNGEGDTGIMVLNALGQPVLNTTIRNSEHPERTILETIELPGNDTFYYVVVSQNQTIKDRHKICITRN